MRNKKVDSIEMETLNDELSEIFYKLKNGEVSISMAKQLSNVAGKKISAARTLMEYNKLQGNNRTIKAMEYGSD